MPKFQSRGTYVVIDTRRKVEIDRVSTMAAAKRAAQDSAPRGRTSRVKWYGSTTDERGVTTWHSDTDIEIWLEA
jgi:hypothetical protein